MNSTMKHVYTLIKNKKKIVQDNERNDLTQWKILSGVEGYKI